MSYRRRSEGLRGLYKASTRYGARILAAAMRSGKIKRAAACERCGEAAPPDAERAGIFAHHDDYNEPLRVRWLCVRCHCRWHVGHDAVPLRDLSVLTPTEQLDYAIWSGLAWPIGCSWRRIEAERAGRRAEAESQAA